MSLQHDVNRRHFYERNYFTCPIQLQSWNLWLSANYGDPTSLWTFSRSRAWRVSPTMVTASPHSTIQMYIITTDEWKTIDFNFKATELSRPKPGSGWKWEIPQHITTSNDRFHSVSFLSNDTDSFFNLDPQNWKSHKISSHQTRIKHAFRVNSYANCCTFCATACTCCSTTVCWVTLDRKYIRCLIFRLWNGLRSRSEEVKYTQQTSKPHTLNFAACHQKKGGGISYQYQASPVTARSLTVNCCISICVNYNVIHPAAPSVWHHESFTAVKYASLP